MKNFYTILTQYGKSALAEALAAQKKLEIPFIAVGDSAGEYYDPNENQTNLRNERWRGDLNDLRTDDDSQDCVIAEAIIPFDIEGDWVAREVGLYDAKGGLIAVGKYPETYIPSAISGSAKQIYINIVVKVGNVAAVSLIINNDTVLASKLFVLGKGYGTVGSFETGLFEIKSLTNPYQLVLLKQESALYYWDGEFPKVVLPGSTPQNTGGIGEGKWVSMRSDIGTVVKTYPTVNAMKSDTTSIVNATVRTLGYYHEYDGGGATYVNRGLGWPQIADGFINHAGTSGNFLELQFSESLNYLQAGGVADWDSNTLTGTDNTPILQNAINYLFPFNWEGSVTATNNVLRHFKCPIFVPGGAGKFMLGGQVLLNPYTSIIGPEVSKSFGMDLFSNKTIGAFFVPKFTDWNKYVFDVAPYDENGQRITDTAIAFTNTDNDQSKYTRVYGINLNNLIVCPDYRSFNSQTGSIPFSPLRLFGSTSSSIKNNFFAQFLHGPSLQACWDYDYDRNLVQSFDSALSIFEGTTGNIGGVNYCNKLGDRRRYSAMLPPWWPKRDDATFIANDYDAPSSLVIMNVKSGKSNIGTWIQEKYNRSVISEGANFHINMLHSESIDVSLIALKGGMASFGNGKTFLPSNRLFRAISRLGAGADVTFNAFDFGCCGPLAEYIEDGVSINLLDGVIASDAANGTPNQGIVQTTRYTVRDNKGTPSIFYAAYDKAPVREMFVNVLNTGLGSDLYYGYDDNSAMSTVGAALKRIMDGQTVTIMVRNGSTSTTAESITTLPVIKNASVTLSSRFSNRPHTITGPIRLDNSHFEFGDRITFNGNVVFSLRGAVSIVMAGQSLISTTGSVFDVAANAGAILNLVKQDGATFGVTGSLSPNSARMSVILLNASSSSAQPSAGWGANTKVL